MRKRYDDVTIIVPTLDEEENITVTLASIISDYTDSSVIVADGGSRDRTKEKVLCFADKNVKFLDCSGQRIPGLTGSILSATGTVTTRYFVVIDADGQHPVEKIKDMVTTLRAGVKLVIASRSKAEKGSGIWRSSISRAGNVLGRMSLSVRGKKQPPHDILSGFFGFNTEFWGNAVSDEVKNRHFRLKGYKILFDFLKYAPAGVQIEQLYYSFGARKSGISKIKPAVYLEYLKSCFGH